MSVVSTDQQSRPGQQRQPFTIECHQRSFASNQGHRHGLEMLVVVNNSGKSAPGFSCGWRQVGMPAHPPTPQRGVSTKHHLPASVSTWDSPQRPRTGSSLLVGHHRPGWDHPPISEVLKPPIKCPSLCMWTLLCRGS